MRNLKNIELKTPRKVSAEQKLFEEIEIGKASADNQGYISFADSKNEILGKRREI